MGKLLHLVQQGRAWVVQSPPHRTKCYSPPINSQYTNFIFFDVEL